MSYVGTLPKNTQETFSDQRSRNVNHDYDLSVNQLSWLTLNAVGSSVLSLTSNSPYRIEYTAGTTGVATAYLQVTGLIVNEIVDLILPNLEIFVIGGEISINVSDAIGTGGESSYNYNNSSGIIEVLEGFNFTFLANATTMYVSFNFIDDPITGSYIEFLGNNVSFQSRIRSTIDQDGARTFAGFNNGYIESADILEPFEAIANDEVAFNHILNLSDNYNESILAPALQFDSQQSAINRNLLTYINSGSVSVPDISLVHQSKTLEYRKRNISTNTFHSPDATSFDGFGTSMALSADGNVLVVGAPGMNSSAGLVYTFDRNIATNSFVPRANSLAYSLSAPGLEFGYSVSLSADGNVLVVGAKLAGSVITYDLSGGNWVEREILALSGEFGSGVSLSAKGDVLVTGNPAGSPHGEVRTFDLVANSWVERNSAFIDLANGLPDGEFGHSVSINSNATMLVVGAPAYQGPNDFQRGAIVTYDLSDDGSVWIKRDGLVTVESDQYESNLGVASSFGQNVFLNGNTLYASNYLNRDSIGILNIYQMDFTQETGWKRDFTFMGDALQELGRGFAVDKKAKLILISERSLSITDTNEIITYHRAN